MHDCDVLDGEAGLRARLGLPKRNDRVMISMSRLTRCELEQFSISVSN